jgi:16S rRNA (uracil1498-N3)-methyltransferase
MDFIVQKATELGVGRLILWPATHGVVRLDSDGQRKRTDHWQAVAVSACEQCGRNRVPGLELTSDLTSALAAAPDADTRLLLSPEGEQGLGAVAATTSSVTLMVGPEGGFAPGELALAHQHHFTTCRLGPRVLRAETAPLAALSALQALAGDLAH